MIRHAWSVVCEKVIIDQITNNLSLDVLEQLNLEGIVNLGPNEGLLLPTRMEIVSLWYRDPADVAQQGRARVRLLGPRREELGMFEYEVNLTTHHRTRARGSVPALPMVGPGFYWFAIDSQHDGEWQEVALVPIQIEATEQPPPAP